MKTQTLCRKKDFCGCVLQKELALRGERCLAPILQITAEMNKEDFLS